MDPDRASSSTTCRSPIRLPRDWRRRSADVGGLQLALASSAAAVAGATAFDHVSAAEGWEGDRDGNDDYNGGGAGVAVPFGAQGQGWMGGEGANIETMYAELLSDMYNETLNSVNDNSLESPPPAVPEHVRSRLIWSLNKWHFEPHKLPDEEVLACTLILFEALFRIDGMQDAVPLTMDQITAFIHHLRRIYRYENKYHNFEHALDVLQATQSYLKSAGIVPPPTILFQPADRRWVPEKSFNGGSLMATLGKRELFMLYVGAIGHDVGHPGFSNMFMKNAQAPLAQLFMHGSALEHMHCLLLLQLMRYHGFHVLLDDPQHGSHLRKLLQESVLMTDMGEHEKFMKTLKSVVDGEQMSICSRQIILCQALLKNADISNPTRPFLVSKHWASALVQEWTAQAHLEEEYHLAQTVPVASSDPVKEADSQIFFIQRFAKPLLELTQKAVPEMWMYLGHCKSNLRTWEEKRRELVSERERMGESERRRAERAAEAMRMPYKEEVDSAEPIVEASPSLSHSASFVSLQSSPIPPPSSPRPFDRQYHTAFPLTLPPPPSTTTSSASSSSGHSPALSVPDSPNTDASECRSVASSSFGGVFSPVSESSTALNVNVGQYSFLSSPPSVTASANASSHAAIRAAGKVGSLRKKSQTGLNSKLPPLPMMLAASLSASSTTSTKSSTSTTSSSGATTSQLEKNGNNSSSTPGKNGKNKMGDSFRFKSSARNSWCASTGLSGLFHSGSGGHGYQRDMSLGKESWNGKGKDPAAHDNAQTTPTMNRDTTTTMTSTRSGRASPSPALSTTPAPLAQPPTVPAPLMTTRTIKVQVSS